MALVHQWVVCSGKLAHNSIVLDLCGRVLHAPSPFKFFEGWLQDPDYQALVYKLWIPIRKNPDTHVAVHFWENLKRIKYATIPWAHEKKLKEEQELKQVGNGRGFCSTEGKEDLVRLELRRRAFLVDKEALWRLKNHAIWLTCGDENIEFFHSYAKGRKMTNTIWGLKQDDGQTVNSFEGMSTMEISHFRDLFKAHAGMSIAEIVKVARLFPHFVEKEEHFSLMMEVSEKELLEVLDSFQKGKSPGSDGWLIEFYLGFYDLLGSDILKVVEESRKNGHIHEPLNSTFIELIPKTNKPSSFDAFDLFLYATVFTRSSLKLSARD